MKEKGYSVYFISFNLHFQIFKIKQGPYHSYDQSSLDAAFKAVKEDGLSVCGAARRYAVPETTLRDRVAGRIRIDTTTTGNPLLFDQEEEALIVDHIKSMAEIGDVRGLSGKF